ncbi:MAG: cation:proton antiporter regulatory subunit [Solirubrobacterales bacterium]
MSVKQDDQFGLRGKAIEETRLPAVGVRHDFETIGERRIGMITQYNGRRKLLVYDEQDPDSCRETVDLSEDDARTLTEILGTPQVVQNLQEVQQAIAGLTIDWLRLNDDSAYAGKTIGDTQMRTRTGVSIVAIVRADGTTEPSPAPECRIDSGDTLVAVGTPEGTLKASELIGPS